MAPMKDAGREATECPSHFRLDRLAMGELAGPEREAVLLHVEACAACQARRAERREAEARHTVDLTLLRRLQVPPEAAAPSPPGRSGLRLVMAAGAALAAAAVLLVLPGANEALRTPETRLKGAAHSALFVAEDGRVRAASEAAVVYPGSTLQVTVSSPERAFAAVVSVDGAGQRSVYVPYAPEGAPAAMVELPAGRDVPLPQSTVLDDVLGPETVAVFICREALADPRALLERATEGEAPAGCVVDRYALDKRARP
jgi:hypothetical protein